MLRLEGLVLTMLLQRKDKEVPGVSQKVLRQIFFFKVVLRINHKKSVVRQVILYGPQELKAFQEELAAKFVNLIN